MCSCEHRTATRSALAYVGLGFESMTLGVHRSVGNGFVPSGLRGEGVIAESRCSSFHSGSGINQWFDHAANVATKNAATGGGMLFGVCRAA